MNPNHVSHAHPSSQVFLSPHRIFLIPNMVRQRSYFKGNVPIFGQSQPILLIQVERRSVRFTFSCPFIISQSELNHLSICLSTNDSLPSVHSITNPLFNLSSHPPLLSILPLHLSNTWLRKYSLLYFCLSTRMNAFQTISHINAQKE